MYIYGLLIGLAHQRNIIALQFHLNMSGNEKWLNWNQFVGFLASVVTTL